MSSVVLIREAMSAVDLLAVLRLRWEIYTEEYGDGSPACDRVSHYDRRARHFGVYVGEEIVGAMRFVFRHEQPAADAIRQFEGPFAPPEGAPVTSSLPTEEAFDLSGWLGDAHPHLDAEVGRFCIRRDHRSRGLHGIMAQSVMALAEAATVRLLLYSCGRDIAPAYMRYTGGRIVTSAARASGVGSERFAFPRCTAAVVCVPREPPSAFARAIEQATEQFRREHQLVWNLPTTA